jgi:ADP-ribose pyrophosphatase
MPSTAETVDPRSLDWRARQATARIPFPVEDGLPVNPVQPDLPEGQGELYHFGERACGDVAVFVTVGGARWLLLGKRDDGHGWALPGGGLEGDEPDLIGALRELVEEAGVQVDLADPRVTVTVDGARYVPDPRAGRNAWMVTTLVVVDLGERPNFPAARAGDDLLRVAWFPARSVPLLEAAIGCVEAGGRLFRAHREMLTDLLGV